MDKKVMLGFVVTPDRRHRYHLAARFEGRTLVDIVTAYLDEWSDGVLRGISLADLVTAHKEEGDAPPAGE